MNCWASIRMIVIAVAFLGATSAQAASLMEQGKENFRNKRFYAAEDCFNRAIQADPQNQLLHYLHAQTFEQLYDNRSAKEAYTDCFRINPFNEQGMAAKQALVKLNGRIEEHAHAATDTPEIMSKTLDTLHRQSSEMQANYLLNGQRQASWTLEAGNRAIRANNDQTRMTLEGLRRGRGVYNSEERQEISSRGLIKSSWLRGDSQSQALRHQAQATTAARELANTAANLEILLAEAPRPGVPKLRALGTNLFVRYYGTDDHADPIPPEDPPIELKATELKLSSLPPIKPQTYFEISTPISLSHVLATALDAHEVNKDHQDNSSSLSQAVGAALRAENTEK